MGRAGGRTLPARAAWSRASQADPAEAGWEIRDAGAAPRPPAPARRRARRVRRIRRPGGSRAAAARLSGPWTPSRAERVRPRCRTELYGGTVKEYRSASSAPRSQGFRWAFASRRPRRATLYLNGRRHRRSCPIPYSPVREGGRRPAPGPVNELVVIVDSRKNPRLTEGWWNWGGINRPVKLVPRGRVAWPISA